MSDMTRELREVKVTEDVLAALSPDTFALFVMFSFTLSECNALWRIFLAARHESTGTPEIDAAISIQQNVILRTWSAKLFEFFDGLPKCSSDVNLRDFTKSMKSELLDSKEQSTQTVIKYFRHEVSNHTKAQAVNSRIRRISPDAITNLYFSDRHAESFFPFGEEVMFAGTFNRTISSIAPSERLAAFKDWAEWIKHTTEQLMGFFDKFLMDFIFNGENPPSWDTRAVPLSGSIFHDTGNGIIPLFIGAPQ